MMAAARITTEATSPKRIYICSSCGRAFRDQNGNFYRAGSSLYKGNNGYLTVCNTCVDEMYDEYLKRYNSDSEAACRRTCNKLDIYYEKKLLDAAGKYTSKTLMGHYMAKLSGTSKYVLTFDDTIHAMNVEGASEAAAYGAELAAEIEEVPDSVRQFWGDGFTKRQYEELQGCYERWTDGKTLAGPDEIGLYRQIALADWQVMNAARKGSKTEQLQQVLNNLLSKTSVSDKRSGTEDTRTVGEKIRDWEKEQPIPEVAPEFKDVDGIVRYITIWFLGHFCKMFNIKNSYNKMYEEEMEKYKVERPEYVESDDDENVFDAIFGGKRGGDDT